MLTHTNTNTDIDTDRHTQKDREIHTHTHTHTDQITCPFIYLGTHNIERVTHILALCHTNTPKPVI